MSIRKKFEEELSYLEGELVRMCRLTEKMIDDATRALAEKNTELARAVTLADRQVDDMEMDIERVCMRMLLRYQPVAGDFRKVSTALKVITDIERICDQASDIADIVLNMKEDAFFDDNSIFIRMGESAKKIVKESVDSFIFNNAEQAVKAAALDDEIDCLFDEAIAMLANKIKEDKESARGAIMYMMIAKYFERIGDHSVNVCEWTGYNLTGKRKKFQ